VHVRLAPKADNYQIVSRCPLWANSGQMHRSKQRLYSITSSARSRNDSGIVKSSAFAAVRLMTSFEFGWLLDRDVGGLSRDQLRRLRQDAIICLGGRAKETLEGGPPRGGNAAETALLSLFKY